MDGLLFFAPSGEHRSLNNEWKPADTSDHGIISVRSGNPVKFADGGDEQE